MLVTTAPDYFSFIKIIPSLRGNMVEREAFVVAVGVLGWKEFKYAIAPEKSLRTEAWYQLEC